MYMYLSQFMQRLIKKFMEVYDCRVHVYTFHNIYIIYMISLLLFFSLILNMHSAID